MSYKLALVISAALALAMGAAGLRMASAHSTVATCGVERWAVKTLTDPDAKKINFDLRPTTVSALRRLSPTHTYARGSGVERTTYRIRASLVKAKLEDDQTITLSWLTRATARAR